MPYGTIKVDTITFTSGTSDVSVAISGLIQNPTFTGNVTVTGTVSGDVIRGQTVSGATVTGTAGQFGTLTGNTAGFTTVTGTTVTGATARFTTTTGVSGVFTSQLSGATVTGDTFQGSNITGVSGVFTTRVSGATVTGNAIVGSTITGVSGVFTTVISGASGVIAGNITASAFIPTGSAVPTNGVYLPSANTVGIATNSTNFILLSPSGTVGIGANPTVTGSQLTVRTTTNGYRGIQIISDTSGDDAGIRFQGGGGKAFRIQQPSASGGLFFYDETLDAIRMRINPSGNVGINNSAPASFLSVGTRTSDITDSSLVFSAGNASTSGEVQAATFCNTGAFAANNATSIGFTCRTGDSRTASIRAIQTVSGSPNTDLSFWTYSNAGLTKGLEITKAQQVLKPLQPSFSANANDLSFTNTGSYVTVTGWTEIHDTAGNFNPTTGLFTAPVAGVYLFGANIRTDGFTIGYSRVGILWNNSTSFQTNGHSIQRFEAYGTTVGEAYYTAAVTMLFVLSANDTVKVAAYSSTDANWTVQNESQFWGYLVG